MGRRSAPAFSCNRLCHAAIPASMAFMLLRSVLEREFASRCRRNRRYSLRSFARFLGIDHSTLSKILRGVRQTPSDSLRRIAPKVGLKGERLAVCAIAEGLPPIEATRLQMRMQHWSA